jgi:proline racemase
VRYTLPCIETTTCGEPTRFVTVFGLPGDTMVAKQAYVRQNLDYIRKALVREPRGHRHMFGGIVTAPVTPGSAFGIIWFDNQDYLPGCGHATLAAGIAMVETGMVPNAGNHAEFAVDVPSGQLKLRVKIENGRATETSFVNVPAFAPITNAEIDVPGIGKLKADVAFGGNFFAIVSAEQVGIEIRATKMSALAAAAVKIREAANQQLKVQHPTLKHLNSIPLISFQGKPTQKGARYINTHMFADGAIDRSPGGTGTSAALAALYAKGEVKIGQEIIAEGIAGGQFRGRLVGETTLGGVAAVVPEITGPAFITGFHQFVLNPDDPSVFGFDMV